MLQKELYVKRFLRYFAIRNLAPGRYYHKIKHYLKLLDFIVLNNQDVDIIQIKDIKSIGRLNINSLFFIFKRTCGTYFIKKSDFSVGFF